MKTYRKSMRMLRALLFVCGIFPFYLTAQTQGPIRCYTDEMDAILRANNPELESQAQFEQWLQGEVAANQAAGKIIGGVYQIPVVVHVIHNGEAVGTGTNVSLAAIQSQIDVLNEDFRRMFGSNGWNTNPVGADTQIEFCLSKRRPDGSAFPNGEDGVNRINRTTAGFTAPPYATTYIDATIKPYTYNNNTPAIVGTYARGWDPNKYMNIWLCDISGGILGYAQFPQSAIGGIGCATTAAATDGVVFLYNSIGKASVTGFPGPYNLGRTATHEIGHWLGLRHIWGDGNCSVDDYCNDTPVAAAANFGCPTGTNSCTTAPDAGVDMIENYMDYTDDACMNVFTNDQKQRMRAVLEGSPMRVSLINSDACTPPNPSDASITDVFAPVGDNCPGALTPSVQLRNRGGNNLTSATISYTIDGGAPTTFSWTGNLSPSSSATVALPSFTSTLGTHTFKAYSTLPNGIADPYTVYDTSSISFVVSNGIQPNYTQDFEATTFPPDLKWNIVNNNGDCFKWSPASGVSISGTFTNNIAQMPCFGNSSTTNDDLYTPIFLLPCNATAATLTFDVAYRKKVAASNDQLIVQISTDCGATWTNVYSKTGNTSPYLWQNSTVLATEYFPTVASDWRTETINLLSYVSAASDQIRFRFRGVSANGNNIFIDNVNFTATTPGEATLTVSGNEVLDGGYYTFANTQVGGTTTATFTMTNTGSTSLTLTNPITVTGTGFALGTGFGTTTLAPGASTTFTVTFNPTAQGSYTGNVSFGTNDCDEGTYNFVLNGLGTVAPPVANFTASSTTICQGSSVTFTNTSTNSTSFAWTFAGGTPGTSTATNPTIQYNTAGTYTVTLVATNAYGSDTKTVTNYITVVASTASALPLSEGFTTATFPPTGWSIVNNNASPTTWARSATIGYAPTAGNSMFFDNYNYNDADDDMIKIKPLILTGYSSSTMTFDVAYAPYNATSFDGLEVWVSSNCGNTWTTVYSKSNTVLATAAATTSAFTPTAAQWRTETVDLTPYVGQANVIVAFKNLSGYGNRLFVDNVNITGVAVSTPPTAAFTPSATSVCAGGSLTFTNTSTGSPTSYSWTFGGGTPATSTATSPTVQFNTAGTYTVSLTATNAAGSTTSNQTITVNALPATPSITAGGPTTFCAGGSVTLSAPASTSYLWSTGATTQSITATTAGTYTVQVTNAAGCQSAASSATTVTVNALPATPSITAGGPTTFCTGGSVTLTAPASTSYAWSTGATTQSITVTTSGSYTVQVTNASGCQSAASSATTVTVNALPATPSITAGGPTTFCAGGSVTLTAPASTSYAWSTGATTQSITVSTSGSYTVQVTNASGCQSAASSATTVTVNALPATPSITAGGPTTFCAGGSVTLTAPASTSYAWSTGATTQSITVSASGSYTVQVTNASGCQSAASSATTVTVNSAPATPSITAGGPTTFCTGGSVTLTAPASTSYVWSTGATTQSITVTTAGSYTVQVTNASGCQSAASSATTVTVNTAPATPSITAGGPTTFCAGGSVTLTAPASTSYAWSTGATTQSITVSTAGSYTVQVSNAAGCQSAASSATTVTVNAAPSTPAITAGGPTTFCTGGSVTLTAPASTSYAWSTGATTQSITVSTSGSYTVQVTNASGCQSAASSATTVTVNTAPATPSITAGGPTTFCAGGSVTLTAPASTSYAWSTGATTQSITVTTAGSYTVQVTNAAGCQSASSAASTIVVNANPVLSSSSGTNPTTCGTSTGAITVNGTGNGTISWTGTASGSQGAASLPATINNLAAGSYQVTLTNGNGCASNIVSVSLSDPNAPTPPVITGNTLLCQGGNVTLNSDYASGNTWNTGSTGTSITVTTSGTYTVSVSVAGCTATSNPFIVTDATPFTVNAGTDQAICQGGSVTLTGSGASTLAWNNSVQDGVAFTPSATATYTLTGTDANGCQATDQVLVTVNPLPTVALASLGKVCTYNPSFALTGGTPAGGTYSGTGVTNNVFDPAVAGAGTFTITYSYTDGNGCSNTATNTIIVDPCLGVDENSDLNLAIYPNPTNGIVSIKANYSLIKVVVYDDLGRMIQLVNVDENGAEVAVDLSKFANGVYQLRIESEIGTSVKSVVVNH